MVVNLNGQIVDDAGNPTGGSVDVSTGALKTPPTASGDPFVTELQQRLLNQTGIVSSMNTNLESKIEEAISGVKTANKASAAKIESEAARAATSVTETGLQKLTSVQESQRGFATNTAVIDKIKKDTDTQLKDLDQRKQELILAGDAAAASKVSELQLQAIQFQQQAQQQAFSNMLGIANFGLQAAQQRQSAAQFNRQMSFQENQAINSVALEYGIKVQPGDTLDSITAKAAPFASEKQRLELEKMRTAIAKDRADIAKASEGSFDGISIDAIATAARSNPALLGALATKDPTRALQVQTSIDKMESKDVQDTIDAAKAGGKSLAETIEAINADTQIWNKGDAIRRVNEALAVPKKAEERITLPSIMRNTNEFKIDAANAIFEFLTGIEIRKVQ